MPNIYVHPEESYPNFDFYTEETKGEKDYIDLLKLGYLPIEVTKEELSFITKATKEYQKAQELIEKKWKEWYPEEE